MRPIFGARVPKYASEPNLCEDAYNLRPYRGVFAVSDGATESYSSAIWARILVERFVSHPGISPDWVTAAVARYNAHFNREVMSWSAQAAFDRGSFATLLGLVVSPSGDRARILGIGDSLAVLLDGDRIIDSFPYRTPEQFKAHPLLLSTVAERNLKLLEVGAFKQFSKDWRLKELLEPKILLMTDALGAWLLSDPQERIAELLGLRSKTAFGALVDRERAAGAMKRDDTTLLRLG